MTSKQLEDRILQQVAQLPALQRVRLALTILRGVAPDDIGPQEGEKPWNAADEDVRLANKLLERQRRLQAKVGEEITKESLLANIWAELA